MRIRYLKSIVNTSVIVCNEIINVTDSVSTDVTSIILVNVRGTVLLISDNKKVRYEKDCYIGVSTDIDILLIIAIICCHYANIIKTKKHIVVWKETIMNFKKFA